MHNSDSSKVPTPPKFTQKYAIIQLLEEVNEGIEFPYTNWPLHVTIADVFAVDWNDTLRAKLSGLLAQQRPFTATAGDDDFFGPERQIQVTLIHNNSDLTALHRTVINTLKEAGAKFNEPNHIEGGFKPHATVQTHARLHKGGDVTFTALTLIDMFPDGNPRQRKVLWTMQLGIPSKSL